ncbi:MAG: hypothetical protein GY820_37285 [Gammaproteobacteria bacterium]|nr:hypothetical protein [Gammaproteobacteria bacterium]
MPSTRQIFLVGQTQWGGGTAAPPCPPPPLATLLPARLGIRCVRVSLLSGGSGFLGHIGRPVESDVFFSTNRHTSETNYPTTPSTMTSTTRKISQSATNKPHNTNSINCYCEVFS